MQFARGYLQSVALVRFWLQLLLSVSDFQLSNIGLLSGTVHDVRIHILYDSSGSHPVIN